MRLKQLLVCSLSLLTISIPTFSQTKEPVDYADPLLGTSESRWMLNPGATMPFGMVQLAPDNQGNVWKSGYEYTLGNVGGFSHIHSWTMSGLTIMPTVGELNGRMGPADGPTTGWETGYRSRVDKSTEKASPGYYAVKLLNGNILTELTSTTRAGFFRFNYTEDVETNIIIDLDFFAENTPEVVDAAITKVSDTDIEGYSKQKWGWQEYTVHFVVRFNKPMKAFGGWNNVYGVMNNVKEIKGKGTGKGKGEVGAYAHFEAKAGDVILCQTGISLVSTEQARLNLETEMDPFNWDFDAVKNNAGKTWNDLLSKITVEGGTEENKKKFYTNLYRSYVARTTWSDVNGKYVDVCEQVRQANSPVYGCDALWNTFWNLNQLWTLVNPDLASNWVKSFLEIYKYGGWLPKGPAGIEYSGIMEASHEIALIVAAYQKGIRDFDVETAFKAMVHQQSEPGVNHACGGFAGNKFFSEYMQLGYVPHESGQVSNTLEYAYDDWCVSQMAKALGRKKEYDTFLRRAGNYKNVFDPETKYIRTKHKDGTWVKEWSPLCCTSFSGSGYLEGNAWQYTFFNPHDVQGILNLVGKDEFNTRLNDGFIKSSKSNFNADADRFDRVPINHGNQPNMQAAWLFNYSGKPWLTQNWVREIMDKYYGSTPIHGWLGDEDEGQMGAWFVMSAMGLFQTDGGTSVKPFYEIGSPLFEKVTIQLDPKYYPGKTFTIEAKNTSKTNRYVQSAMLDGKPLTKPWFYHSELIDGGKLELVMGDKPNEQWGSAPGDGPPSMSVAPTVKKKK